MTLPPRLAKKAKGDGRWKSQRHRNFVRDHACTVCQSRGPIEVAHVRIGSGAGMGQKPDDFRCVSLCKVCHQRQHERGERTFWQELDVEAVIDAFNRASPVWPEIRARLA